MLQLHAIEDEDGNDVALQNTAVTLFYKADIAGEFDYYCQSHSAMTGKIIVT